MKVLVTGGTGTVGHHLVRQLLRDPGVESIRVLGRSEYRILQFKQAFPGEDKLDVVSGDVSDRRAMAWSCAGMDTVFHLAAMKHVDLIEKDPHLAMLTNIEGTQTTVDAALGAGVGRFVLMSTDKVVHASSLYGATKLVSEKIVLAANRVRPIFNVFRSGNVLNSSGSVFEVWRRQIARDNTMAVTDPTMTRFFMRKGALAKALAGMPKVAPNVVYVPRNDALRLRDLVVLMRERYGDAKTKTTVIGRRPGEKQHEELISVEELARTRTAVDHYLVGPSALTKPLDRVPISARFVLPKTKLRAILDQELAGDDA
ncbi:MAG TPA: polysaccharide biosynthesis protein [Candidatus Thermoplasmatota archaeon]|nr:polysaccharide biosynthesis protein [Candidatus Thermoplasmatota archaeon]